MCVLARSISRERSVRRRHQVDEQRLPLELRPRRPELIPPPGTPVRTTARSPESEGYDRAHVHPQARRGQRQWHVIDATDVVLGRLASQAATLLRGKHKPTFAPHVDTGDFVIIINADKVALTGTKLAQKMAYRHSGLPGWSARHLVRRAAGERPAARRREGRQGNAAAQHAGPAADQASSRSTRARAPARGAAAGPVRDHPGRAVSHADRASHPNTETWLRPPRKCDRPPEADRSRPNSSRG